MRQTIASALNVDSKYVSVQRWRLSPGGRSLRCWGSTTGRRFFAKIFLADPYPVFPRLEAPWEEAPSPREHVRSVDDQIETEWSMTHQLRAFAGPGHIAAPLGRSKAAKTIVWEEVKGARLNDLVERSRWMDPKGGMSAAALFQAGAWLRKIHDSSFVGAEAIDPVTVINRVREYVEKQGLRSSKYRETATSLVEAALAPADGGGKLSVPVALNHGDFTLANLVWDRKAGHLSVTDFEHVGPRAICYDLVTLVYDLRFRLLKPLIAKQVILSSEESFWAGYGSIAKEVSIFVGAMATSRVFYSFLPHLSAHNEGQGWKERIKVSVYKAFFENFMVKRRLGVPSVHDCFR